MQLSFVLLLLLSMSMYSWQIMFKRAEPLSLFGLSAYPPRRWSQTVGLVLTAFPPGVCQTRHTQLSLSLSLSLVIARLVLNGRERESAVSVPTGHKSHTHTHVRRGSLI